MNPSSITRPRNRLSAAVGVSLLSGCGAALIACAAVNARPYVIPLSDAIADTLPADPALVISIAESLVTAEGWRVRTATAREGYLDTDWRREQGQADAVRLRFFTTPVGQSLAELLAEAVIARTVDPSLPPRQREAMAPPEHWGGTALRRILASIRERFGGGAS